MSDDEDYEVEDIRKWRYNLKLKRKEFLIKWRGYPEDQNTWEPEDYLNCERIIKKFRKSLGRRQRECLDSKDPENLTGLQRNADITTIYGRFEKGRASTSSGATNSEGVAVIYATFEDDQDTVEKLDLEELREFCPEKAFEFIEQRLIDKKALD